MLDGIRLFTNYADIDCPRFVAVRNGAVIRGHIVPAWDNSGRGYVAEIDGVSWRSSCTNPTPAGAVEMAAVATMGPDPRDAAARLLLDAATTEGDIAWGDGAQGDAPWRFPHADTDGHCAVAGADKRTTDDRVYRSRNVVSIVNVRQFTPELLEWWTANAPTWQTLSAAQMALVERFGCDSETHLAYSSWFRSTDDGYSVATFAVAPTVRGQRIAVYAPTTDNHGERIALEGFDAPAAIVGATTWSGADGDEDED